MLERAPATHIRFLEELKAKTKNDSRLLGVAVAGSLANGTADAESDIDLQIVVKDSDYDHLLNNRRPFVSQFGNILSEFTGEHVGEPRLTIVLFERDLLHVDFKFVTLEAFRDHRVDDPAVLWQNGSQLSDLVKANPRNYPEVNVQWIEDRFWVWIHYVASKIKRGEYLEALDAFCWMRPAALVPMVRAIKGQRNRASRFLERDAPEYSAKILRTNPTGASARELTEALVSAVDLYVELRASYTGRIELRSQAEAAVRGYLQRLQDGLE